MEFFSNKGQSKQKIKLFVVVSALFCNLFWFSRTFGECFSSKFMHCPVDPDWQQYHSSNVLEIEIRSQNSAYTVRKSFIFRVLSTLFPQLPFDMNRDILKNPTEVELKIVTNSVYFVIWSHGFPTMYMDFYIKASIGFFSRCLSQVFLNFSQVFQYADLAGMG